jgi:hypothetical protein
MSARSLAFVSTIWSFIRSRSASGSVGPGALEPLEQVDPVAHLEAVEEHVALAPVGPVPEEEPPGAVERVELGIRLVPELGQERDDPASVPASARE